MATSADQASLPGPSKPRARMATSADQASLPGPSKLQKMNEEEDDIPQSLYVSNSREAINIKMVFTADDLKPDHPQRSFKPELVFQIFGESEAIYGYRNLSIDIYFMANSANCFVDLKHNAIANSTKGPPPDDIFQKLAVWLPDKYITDKRQFLHMISKENHAQKFGETIDKFETYNEQEEQTYKYVITQCSASEPGFAEFHSRFQCLLVWFIDAANQIDVHDACWMFLYVYEQRKLPNKKHYAYYPVGYCTVYKFFHFPDKVRTRIAQLFILPPCQRTGIGSKLLNAAYKVINRLPNVIDIAVEDPCDAFTRMRDILDCQLLMQLEKFRYPAIGGGFTKEMFDEANAHFKFNKRQCRRAYEIVRMAYIFLRRDNADLQRLYREIKTHIEIPYIREQEAIKRKKIVTSRRVAHEPNIVYQSADNCREIGKNVDIYFMEIKASAHNLCRKLKDRL